MLFRSVADSFHSIPGAAGLSSNAAHQRIVEWLTFESLHRANDAKDDSEDVDGKVQRVEQYNAAKERRWWRVWIRCRRRYSDRTGKKDEEGDKAYHHLDDNKREMKEKRLLRLLRRI